MVMFTFIMRYCLIERWRSYELLLNRACFFKGRFKLIKLEDDVCNPKEIATYMEANCHIFLENLV